MKILSGTYSNYGGSVICKGEEIHMKCEKDAFKYGISIVAQELNYVSELSIAENLFLGREPKKGKVFVNKAERLKETQRLLDEMGLDYNPREKMGNLNVAQRQMIEILKSLSRDSRVIIMDEPTSALTSKESEILFSKVEKTAEAGRLQFEAMKKSGKEVGKHAAEVEQSKKNAILRFWQKRRYKQAYAAAKEGKKATEDTIRVGSP